VTVIVQTQRYAGFWIRVGAYLIDAIALSVVGSLLGSNAHYGPEGYDQFARSRDLSGLLNLIYFVAFWTYNGGQTVGNRLLGLRVVKIDGTPVTLGTAIVRWIGLVISFVVILLGVIFVGFDSKKQGWHDKMARTVVVHSA
jgi:uncharacterized RDD family membrane protein YckC